MKLEMMLTKAVLLLWRCGTILRIISPHNEMIQKIDDFISEVQAQTDMTVTL